MSRTVFVPRGLTNVRPCGKSNVGYAHFAAGVSTTQASRHRAGGPSHANPTHRSANVAIQWTASDPRLVLGQMSNRGTGRVSRGRTSK